MRIWGVTRLSKISNNFVINSAVSGGGEAGILANGSGNFLLAGRLRIKNGTPTSDLDGTIVGTQT